MPAADAAAKFTMAISEASVGLVTLAWAWVAAVARLGPAAGMGTVVRFPPGTEVAKVMLVVALSSDQVWG